MQYMLTVGRFSMKQVGAWFSNGSAVLTGVQLFSLPRASLGSAHGVSRSFRDSDAMPTRHSLDELYRTYGSPSYRTNVGESVTLTQWSNASTLRTFKAGLNVLA